jgi:hypothetical protein
MTIAETHHLHSAGAGALRRSAVESDRRSDSAHLFLAGSELEGVRRATQPVHRMIIVVDVEGSAARSNPEKEELRFCTYEVLQNALHLTGIRNDHLERFTDRGDGVLILIRPADEIPKTLLLGPFVLRLASLLEDYNRRSSVTGDAMRPLRLRVSIHAGEVHDDGRGFFGEALDLSCRLLDAQPVKKALRQAGGSLAVVVSNEIYSSIVRHDYADIDSRTYSRAVRVRIAGRQQWGWIYAPEKPV